MNCQVLARFGARQRPEDVIFISVANDLFQNVAFSHRGISLPSKYQNIWRQICWLQKDFQNHVGLFIEHQNKNWITIVGLKFWLAGVRIDVYFHCLAVTLLQGALCLVFQILYCRSISGLWVRWTSLRGKTRTVERIGSITDLWSPSNCPEILNWYEEEPPNWPQIGNRLV